MKFAGIKKGDTVALSSASGWAYPPVVRVGSTWFRAGGLSFRKDNGRECGNDFHPRYAEVDTPEAREKHRSTALRAEIAKLLPRDQWQPCEIPSDRLAAALRALRGES
jgi:hypothetical protein